MMSTCMPQGAQQSVPIGRYKLRVKHVVSVVAAPARHLWGNRRVERRGEHLHADGHVAGEVSSPVGNEEGRAP